MKVLHYKSNFLNPSETFIRRLINNHVSFEPVGLCVHPLDFTENLKVYSLPKAGFYGILNQALFKLNLCPPYYPKTIRRIEPDLIHAHFGLEGYRMIAPSQKTELPLIVSFYGSDVTRLPYEWGWKTRYRRLSGAASAFVAASERMKQQLIKLGFPSKKITVIRFGIDSSGFPFKMTNERSKPAMMVGRMVEKKGFVYALKAVKILAEQGINLQLDLYGDGPERPKLERLCRQYEISHLVSFKGFQPIELINRAHESHSLLLAPSVTASDGDEEGLPNTILESMARGTPVITTRHAAIPEAIFDGKTGFLVSEKNASELAGKIRKYIDTDDDSIEEIRSAARKHIESSFTIKRMVENIETLYKSLT